MRTAITAILLTLTMSGVARAQADADIVATQDLDAYIDKTFGDTFTRTGPVMMARPGAVLNEKYAVAVSVPVTYAHTATLDSDLLLPPDRTDGIIVPKGTLLYRVPFRRVATDADPQMLWCGGYIKKYGLRDDLDGHSIICFGKTADGKATFYYYPDFEVRDITDPGHIVYKPFEAPQRFPSSLKAFALPPYDYPALTEGPVTPPTLTLSLVISPPWKGKPESTTSIWEVEDGQRAWALMQVRGKLEGNTFRLMMGAPGFEADVAADFETITGIRLSADAASESTAPAAPFDTRGDYVPYFVPLDAHPVIVDTPWRFGAMTALSDSLTFATAPLAKGSVLVTASAALKDRYRVTADDEVAGILFNAGDYVYAYDETGYQPDRKPFHDSTWCGVGKVKDFLGYSPFNICWPTAVQAHPAEILQKVWEIDDAGKTTDSNGDTLLVTPDPDPAPQVETLQLRIASIDDMRVSIVVGLVRKTKFLGVRTYVLNFNKDGVATFHLWDKVITLRRQDKKMVVPVISDSSLGLGPYYGAQVWDDNL